MVGSIAQTGPPNDRCSGTPSAYRRCVEMVRFQGAGRSSGAPVDLPIAWTFEFRNGCIARVKINLDRAEALDAVGRAE
jgi:ketosteroid isomerase-like protein